MGIIVDNPEKVTLRIEDYGHSMLLSLYSSNRTESSGEDEIPYRGLIFALFMMFESIDTRREQVESQIKALGAKAQGQRILNQRISEIEYVRFPEGVNGQPPTNEEIERVNSENARLNLIRSNLESRVMSIRQEAQVDMTNTQASISTQQIYISQASNAMHTFATVAKKINQMNERFM